MSFNDLHNLNMHTQASRMHPNRCDESVELQHTTQWKTTCVNRQAFGKPQSNLKLNLAFCACLINLRVDESRCIKNCNACRTVTKRLCCLKAEQQAQVVDFPPDE